MVPIRRAQTDIKDQQVFIDEVFKLALLLHCPIHVSLFLIAFL